MNLNYLGISALVERETLGGARFMTPVGEPNPWMVLGQLSSYLLLAFFLEAAIAEWRKPTSVASAKIIRICLSMVAFIVLATLWHLAVVAGSLHLPVAILPAFTGVLLVMSYELGGDVIRAGTLSSDLSKAKGTLRQSEQRIEDAVLAAGFGLWDWDLASGNVWMSLRAKELLEIPAAQAFRLSTFTDRVDPEGRRAFKASLRAARSAGGPFLFEYQITNAQGRRRWLLVRGQCETDFRQQPIRLRGVLVDITERKHAYEQIRAVVESTPTAMIVADTRGRIRFANARAEQDFGWNRAELCGMVVDQIVPRHFLDLARGADQRGLELYGIRRSGSAFEIEARLNDIEFEGEPAVLISLADIGERKRMERDSAVQRDELAHLSRVALLAELSGSLAHELNQPLTSILSNAQAAIRFMARDPSDLEEVRESLDNIIHSDKHASEVIRRLRTLLRKAPSDFQPVDLGALVKDVLRILASDLLNKRVIVRLKLHASLPQADGDAVQLQQVLLNLIVNGADAMQGRPHGRELTIASKTRKEGIEIVVSDLGPGIPPADLERIFSPFVTTKQEGMGLGLAVCRTIIEAHRGRLWATNNPDGGASLHFWLPAPVHAVQRIRAVV